MAFILRGHPNEINRLYHVPLPWLAGSHEHPSAAQHPLPPPLLLLLHAQHSTPPNATASTTASAIAAIAPFPIPRPDDAEVMTFPLGLVGIAGCPAELGPARACVRAGLGLGLTTPKDAPDERLAPRPGAEPDADADSSARDVGYAVGDVVEA